MILLGTRLEAPEDAHDDVCHDEDDDDPPLIITRYWTKALPTSPQHRSVLQPEA